jgi:hypothetical protein
VISRSESLPDEQRVASLLVPPELAVDVARDPRSAVAEREEAAPVADTLIL